MGKMPNTSQAPLAVITINDIPAVNPTAKYEVLGRMAVEDRRRFCARHRYDFTHECPIDRSRPACWAKIPAILNALATHDWVLWADSDVLSNAPHRSIEPLCDPAYDLIVQSHDRYYRTVGLPVAEATRRMPLNTGVFLVRASEWSRDFLLRAYKETEFVTHSPIWDGIGEQEAMIALLHRAPEDLRRIKYVDDLQAPPCFLQPDTMFVHFYGSRARHLIPPGECTEVFARWQRATDRGGPLPSDPARFHWCCIQNKRPEDAAVGGDLARYLYRTSDILPQSTGGRSGGVR